MKIELQHYYYLLFSFCCRKIAVVREVLMFQDKPANLKATRLALVAFLLVAFLSVTDNCRKG
jgi:hypothetical protein